MNHILAFILTIPILVWSTFQPSLNVNASMIEQDLRLATYEGQKEAALQGRYDEDIYKQIRDHLVENQHYNPEKIEIEGTETIKERGERITISITIPKPTMQVIEMFSYSGSDTFTVERTIVSEYVS